MALAKKVLVVGILLGLFSVGFIVAGEIQTTGLVFIRSEIGFSSACSYYEIKNTGLLELKDTELKTLRLSDSVELQNTGYVNGVKEVIGTIKNGVWEYFYTETYDCSFDKWVSKITCETVFDQVNKTDYEVCTDNGYFELVKNDCERDLWITASDEKLKEVTLANNKVLQVRFCADIEREVTEKGWSIKVDHIPEFEGVQYKEYAWWDGSYAARYEIIETSNETGVPIGIRNTTMFGSQVYWTATTSEAIYIYCIDTNCNVGQVAIANQTHEKCWENEANMTGNCPTEVWANGEWVVHGHNITLNDSSSNAGSSLMVNAPTTATGVFGNAILFPDDDHYNWPANLGIYDGDFTIEFWFNPTVATRSYIFTFEGEKNMFIEYDNDEENNKVRFLYYDAGAEYIASNVLSGSEWYYFTMIINNTNSDIYLYENGAYVSSSIGTVGVITNKSVTNAFGSNTNGALALQNGYVDDVIVSSVPVSEDYIAARWNNGNRTLITIGDVELSESITLTTLRPDNTTYATASITINGSTDNNANVTWSEDGGANQTACNVCTNFENTTILAEGTHDIFIYAVFATGTIEDSNQTFFTIDLTAPVVTVVRPTGTNQTNATLPLDYSVTDALSAVDTCMYSLNNATNVTVGACANTTLAVTQAGTHNITVYANDTAGWEGEDSSSFTYDPLQNFTANDSLSGDPVSDFQVVVVGYATGSTANGTIPILTSEIGYGARTVRFVSAGYNTTDFDVTFTNESLLTENFTIVPASVNITVFDETQAGLGVYTNITFNITITNTTQSTTWYNQGEFLEYANSTPIGDVTVDLSSYGYQARRYYITINDNSANAFTGYLLPTADALYVRFNIRTITEQAIEGALVTAERFIGSGWVTVGQRYSDEAGTAAIYLNPTVSYKINVTATGYVGQYLTLTPSNTDYRIYLQASGGDGTFETGLTNITMTFLPADLSLNSTNNTFTCWITASDEGLDYVGFNITNYTGVVLFTNTTTTASGVRLNTTIDLSGMNGTNVTAVCFFKRTGYTSFNVTRTYHIFNMTGGLLGSLGSTGLSGSSLAIISALVTAVTAGFVTRFGRNGVAGGFAGAIVLGICTFYFGWFDWQIYLLIITTLGGLLVLRGGI